MAPSPHAHPPALPKRAPEEPPNPFGEGAQTVHAPNPALDLHPSSHPLLCPCPRETPQSLCRGGFTSGCLHQWSPPQLHSPPRWAKKGGLPCLFDQPYCGKGEESPPKQPYPGSPLRAQKQPPRPPVPPSGAQLSLLHPSSSGRRLPGVRGRGRGPCDQRDGPRQGDHEAEGGDRGQPAADCLSAAMFPGEHPCRGNSLPSPAHIPRRWDPGSGATIKRWAHPMASAEQPNHPAQRPWPWSSSHPPAAGILCPDLVPTLPEGWCKQERGQRRARRRIKKLENLPYRERLNKAGVGGGLVTDWKFLHVLVSLPGKGLTSQWLEDEARSVQTRNKAYILTMKAIR